LKKNLINKQIYININNKNNKNKLFKLINKNKFKMQQEKQKYINDNIIDKGYNPEDLSNFISQKKATNLDEISLKELKVLIEEFKNERLSLSIPKLIESENKNKEIKNNNENEIKEKVKVKEESLFDKLYPNGDYEFETKKQQESIMFNLEKENKKINIIISEPQNIEKSGFFYQKTVNFICNISSKELNSNVKRTFSDFEWFKNQLNLRYPFILISPLIKSINFYKLDSNGKIRYLNRFIKGILRKKIIRTSPLTYEFFTLEKNEFDKYCNNINSIPFNINNLKTIKGKINCSLNKDKYKKVGNLIKILNPSIELISKLINSFDVIINDFNNISIHMNELSNFCLNLSILSKNIFQYSELQNFYLQLSKTFKSWSFSYLTQSKFFKEDFTEFFNYINLEYNEFETIHNQYLKFKKDYEIFSIELNDKKENLFKNKNFSKWNVEPGIFEDLNLIQNDKKLCFSLMCHKENLILESQKKIVIIAINLINQQFEKLQKYQIERIKDFFNNIKENNQIIFSDSYNLIKMFSIKLNENIN
jgi:hypothetical protein